MPKNHTLHIKIDEEMKEQLRKLAADTGKSMSSQVADILNHGSCLLDKRYFYGKEQESRYQRINADMGMARVSLHVYLQEEVYRHLKLVHQDLNFFSLAQIVRWMIRVYLGFKKKFEADVNDILEKMGRWWNIKKMAIQVRMNCVLQLFPFCHLKEEEVSLVSVYNRDFSPIRDNFTKTL